MKVTTSMKMAVLAGAVCALVALPAFAYGHVLSDSHDLIGEGIHDVEKPHLIEQPPVEGVHMALDPAVIDAILDAGDDASDDAPDEGADEGPFPDGGGDEMVGPDEFEEDSPVFPDAGGDEAVFRPSADETPSITTTETVTHPRRPDLPYTGGNSLGWILAGVAVASLGVALTAAGYGAGRRNDAR